LTGSLTFAAAALCRAFFEFGSVKRVNMLQDLFTSESFAEKVACPLSLIYHKYYMIIIKKYE
jgi:hypothetical protein